MEIEDNEYIRTKKGLIFKATEYWLSELTEEIKENIKLHSKDIIDLIEEGDYVNGHLVYRIDNNITIWLETKTNTYCGIYEKDIKSIVTKEMYKSVEYEVE